MVAPVVESKKSIKRRNYEWRQGRRASCPKPCFEKGFRWLKYRGILSRGPVVNIVEKNIGFIFQKLNLIEHLTVKENIALVLTQPCSLVSVAQALKTVDLSGRENQMIASMSLGEQQRVAVARMILSQSSLTLAHEPTSSLDALRVAEALVEANSKRTLVTVSQDPRIEDYFDRVVEFENLCRV